MGGVLGRSHGAAWDWEALKPEKMNPDANREGIGRRRSGFASAMPGPREAPGPCLNAFLSYLHQCDAIAPFLLELPVWTPDWENMASWRRHHMPIQLHREFNKAL